MADSVMGSRMIHSRQSEKQELLEDMDMREEVGGHGEGKGVACGVHRTDGDPHWILHRDGERSRPRAPPHLPVRTCLSLRPSTYDSLLAGVSQEQGHVPSPGVAARGSKAGDVSSPPCVDGVISSMIAAPFPTTVSPSEALRTEHLTPSTRSTTKSNPSVAPTGGSGAHANCNVGTTTCQRGGG